MAQPTWSRRISAANTGTRSNRPKLSRLGMLSTRAPPSGVSPTGTVLLHPSPRIARPKRGTGQGTAYGPAGLPRSSPRRPSGEQVLQVRPLGPALHEGERLLRSRHSPALWGINLQPNGGRFAAFTPYAGLAAALGPSAGRPAGEGRVWRGRRRGLEPRHCPASRLAADQPV